METRLHFEILPQPDDTTCGPTCLQSIYNYYGDSISLAQVINEVPKLEGGGTLAVLMGCHALERGYSATIYTFDMQVFDPTWFALPRAEMADKLKHQVAVKNSPSMKVVTDAYLKFLTHGGKILLADLTMSLIRRFLKKRIPIITGLSSTYLYRCPREVDLGNILRYDDINGVPTGHFTVLYGYQVQSRTAIMADPLHPNPMSNNQHYEVKLNRLIPAIMLGTLTLDANLLVITKKSPTRKRKA